MPYPGSIDTLTLTVSPFGVTTAATVNVSGPGGVVLNPTATTADSGHTWLAQPTYTVAGQWVALWTVTGTGAGVWPQVIDVDPIPTAEAELTDIPGGLFTAADLTVYAGVTVTQAQYNLAHELVLDAILAVVGADVLTSPLQAGVKLVALDAAKRFFSNPGGLRERAIDDYREVFASETLAGMELTAGEIARLLRAVGSSAAAFTIRPGGGGTLRYPSESTYVLQRRYPWN